MRLKQIFLLVALVFAISPVARADSLFFEDEPVQDGLRVFDMSKTFNNELIFIF